MAERSGENPKLLAPKRGKEPHSENINARRDASAQIHIESRSTVHSKDILSRKEISQTTNKPLRPGFEQPSFLDNEFDPPFNNNLKPEVENVYCEQNDASSDQFQTEPVLSEAGYSDSYFSIFTVEDRGHRALMDRELLAVSSEEVPKDSNDRSCASTHSLLLPTFRDLRSANSDVAKHLPGQQPGGSSSLNQPSPSTYKTLPAYPSCMPECDINAEKIADEIRIAYAISAPDNEYFLPYDKLRKIINTAVVDTLLRNAFPSHDDQAIENLVTSILGHKNNTNRREKPPRRKIFAILVMMEEVQLVEDFIRGDIEDGDLPLIIERNNNSSRVVQLCKKESAFSEAIPSGVHLKPLTSLNAWSSKVMEDFVFRQERICTPFFELPGEKVCFYDLQNKPILPFLQYDHPCVGGYGSVRKVHIHHAHYSHNEGCKVQEGTSRYFAVKELHLDSEEAYRREVELFEKIGVGKKDRTPEHLIQLQLSYRYGSRYFLVFPWADGNLREFWEKNSLMFNPSSQKDTVWFFSQCRGLVRALRRIHHFSTMSNPKPNAIHFDINLLLDSKEWGRHGDIKPENILWFQKHDNEKDFLVISDFGLTSFNSAHSRSMVAHDSITGCSGTYRPPEMDLRQRISQRYDIWSLACVYLEFISWFLLGYVETQDHFTTRRVADEKILLKGCIPEDKFFILEQSSQTSECVTEAKVKHSVICWIDKLHKHQTCTEPLHAFLDLIQFNMLLPNSKDRLNCEHIDLELKVLLNKCEKDTKYATEGSQEMANPDRFSSGGMVSKEDLVRLIRGQVLAEGGPRHTTLPSHSSELRLSSQTTLVSEISALEGLSNFSTVSETSQSAVRLDTGEDKGLLGSGSQFD